MKRFINSTFLLIRLSFFAKFLRFLLGLPSFFAFAISNCFCYLINTFIYDIYLNMKSRLLENENDIKERFLRGMQKLQYIVSNVTNNKLIQEIIFTNIEFQKKSNTYQSISCDLVVKSWCDDFDMGVLCTQLDRVDTEIVNVISAYNFDADGKLITVSRKNSLMMILLDSVKWTHHENDGEITITYNMLQDDFEHET